MFSGSLSCVLCRHQFSVQFNHCNFPFQSNISQSPIAPPSSLPVHPPLSTPPSSLASPPPSSPSSSTSSSTAGDSGVDVADEDTEEDGCIEVGRVHILQLHQCEVPLTVLKYMHIVVTCTFSLGSPHTSEAMSACTC